MWLSFYFVIVVRIFKIYSQKLSGLQYHIINDSHMLYIIPQERIPSYNWKYVPFG